MSFILLSILKNKTLIPFGFLVYWLFLYLSLKNTYQYCLHFLHLFQCTKFYINWLNPNPLTKTLVYFLVNQICYPLNYINFTYNPDDIFLSIFFYFLNPIFNSFERLPVCHIIHNHNTMSSFIITACYGFKSVLTCGIPL